MEVVCWKDVSKYILIVCFVHVYLSTGLFLGQFFRKLMLSPGKVKVVGSKLREEGPRGARRSAWCLLAAALFYQGWSDNFHSGFCTDYLCLLFRKFNAILCLFLGLAFLVFLLLPFLFRFIPFIQVGRTKIIALI